MTTRKALFATCLAAAALMTSSAFAGGFSIGFSYNDYPHYYRSYCAPTYGYYGTAPVYYADAAPVVVYSPPPVYYAAPPVVYYDAYPRVYGGTTIYTSGYRSYYYPRYSYRHYGYDRGARVRAGVRVGW